MLLRLDAIKQHSTNSERLKQHTLIENAEPLMRPCASRDVRAYRDEQAAVIGDELLVMALFRARELGWPSL